MQDNRGTRPVLFVMGLQQGVVKNPGAAGLVSPHLNQLSQRICDFADRARTAGVDIVWLFHARAHKDAHLVTTDFARAKDVLIKEGDAPLTEAHAKAGDQFWILPRLDNACADAFHENCKALRLLGRPAVGIAGIEYEAPCADGTYYLAHDLAEEIFRKRLMPAILEDLTDNHNAVANDENAQRNISYLKNYELGKVMWMQSADWLHVVQETTQPPVGPLHPPLSPPRHQASPTRAFVTDKGIVGKMSCFPASGFALA